MAYLYGWQRKLALVPLSLFVLGWLIYSAGFTWMLIKWDETPLNSTPTPVVISRHDLLVFPYYCDVQWRIQDLRKGGAKPIARKIFSHAP